MPEIEKVKVELFDFVENNDEFFSTCELGTTEEAVQDLLYDVPPIVGNAEKLGFIQANDFEYRGGTSRKRAEFEKKI